MLDILGKPVVEASGFLRVFPGSAVLPPPGNLLDRNACSWAPPSPSEPKTLGVGLT